MPRGKSVPRWRLAELDHLLAPLVGELARFLLPLVWRRWAVPPHLQALTSTCTAPQSPSDDRCRHLPETEVNQSGQIDPFGATTGAARVQPIARLQVFAKCVDADEEGHEADRRSRAALASMQHPGTRTTGQAATPTTLFTTSLAQHFGKELMPNVFLRRTVQMAKEVSYR
jgi:hypothetical protein